MKLTTKYPTLDEIEQADRITIARWYRYLPSPGVNFLGEDNFLIMCNYQAMLMNRINERFVELGGMTPELSKLISWKDA